jgi:predicted Zn-dependent peptidase
MIEFERFVLPNGLRVILHRDTATPLVAVNMLYDAGSRVESPNMTGMAHLFEHLMFSGTRKVKDFDEAIQMAGGDANAYTNTDITNFYEMMPAENLETALWLESDRMRGLNLKPRKVNLQKKVVIEEFKETCLDQPYGNLWHLLAGLAYKEHPYRWPTIGQTPEHIERIQIQDLQAYFNTWYSPDKATLAIAGNIEITRTRDMVIKWFEDIPTGPTVLRHKIVEPTQTERREITDFQNVPVNALYMGFLSPGRNEKSYYAADLLTDILANGPSSRLYRNLVMEKELFSHVDCYQTGTVDPGLIIIEGKPTHNMSLEEAEKHIWAEINQVAEQGLSERELQKIKHKNEASIAFSQVSAVHKSMNLAYFEWLGDANGINTELEDYQSVTVADIQEFTQNSLQPSKLNIVKFKSN